ncbi:MAG: DUF1549 domain-containing protein, partial [Pirellulaceae bacterium]
MTDESDEPIIDACLDEVLGGQTPPNLTARILRAWDDAGSKDTADGTSRALTPHTEAGSATRPAATFTANRLKASRTARRESSPLLAMTVSLALIGLGSAFVWVTWNAVEVRNRNAPRIAAPETSPPPAPVAPVPNPQTLADAPREPRPASTEPMLEPATPSTHSLAGDPVSDVQDTVQVPELDIPDERPVPLAEEQIVHAINELIRQGWQSEGIAPAQPVADETWCRRVYAKLIGREPAAREVQSFVASRSPKKREELVNLLLQGETYIEEFASHWSHVWADILLASGDQRASREGLEQYLRRTFGEGKPFDKTTSELLTATGGGRIGAADYNGATNFVLAHADRQGVYAEVTAHVSRTFMGLSLECAQCHVDATWSGIEQQRFWELNAFFRQLETKPHQDGGLRLVDTDIGARDSRSGDGETYYPLLDGTMKAAYPAFVDGTAIPRLPRVEQVNRRQVLAKFVTRSEQFRQAMANRFWAELFGVGFTIPADNIGPHNPPSHPELLAKLGGQFAAHDYDVRALIRWIALSEPFALSTGDVATHDQIGAKLVFDRFPQASPPHEPVLKRLQVAHEAYATIASSSGDGSNLGRVVSTTTPGAVPAELSDVDQRLATVAAEAHHLGKSTVYGNYILGSDMSREQKVRHMFFATLHRTPTAREQQAVMEVLANSTATTEDAAWEYIWWALA